MNVVVVNSVLYSQNLREVDRRRVDGSVEAQNRFFTFNWKPCLRDFRTILAAFLMKQLRDIYGGAVPETMWKQMRAILY